MKVVIDTNVFVSAILSPDGTSREVLRRALKGHIVPLFGNALFSEYEDLLGRRSVWNECVISEEERDELFDAVLSVSQWVRVFYLWRPNLPDEADNHLIELAIAGNAEYVVTDNIKDLKRGELTFDGLRVLKPYDFIQELDNEHTDH